MSIDLVKLLMVISMLMVNVNSDQPYTYQEEKFQKIFDTSTTGYTHRFRPNDNKSNYSIKKGLSNWSKLKESSAKITYERNHFNENGSYRFAYQTENGIHHVEEGNDRYVTGSYSYESPERQLITVNYEADVNGYHPRGEHLPTPPPIPDAYFLAIRLHELASGRGIEEPPLPHISF